MASLISMSTTNSFPFSRAVSGDARVSHFFAKPTVSTKKTKTNIVNVATNLPGISKLEKQVPDDDRKLVAWTSVQQERWEGELNVEGEIPKWLVCIHDNYDV